MRGYGSMVEHLVANQMMGVRFSLPAPKEAERKPSNLVFSFTPSEVWVWAFPYQHEVSDSERTMRDRKRNRGSPRPSEVRVGAFPYTHSRGVGDYTNISTQI